MVVQLKIVVLRHFGSGTRDDGGNYDG